MKILEAYKILKPLENTSLASLGLLTNKGVWGHTIEKYLSLKLGSHHLDFDDGELKTATVQKNGTLKEDFKIAKVWDKQYLEEKMASILLVVRDINNNIIKVKVVKPLQHPVYKKYFDIELNKISTIGLESISQSDTIIWVAKTNDTGKKVVNARALYLSRAFASHLFGFGFGRATKGKQIYKEILEYEQTSSRS